MKKTYNESVSAIRMTRPTAPIQSNRVINQIGRLKYFSNSFISFIIVKIKGFQYSFQVNHIH